MTVATTPPRGYGATACTLWQPKASAPAPAEVHASESDSYSESDSNAAAALAPAPRARNAARRVRFASHVVVHEFARATTSPNASLLREQDLQRRAYHRAWLEQSDFALRSRVSYGSLLAGASLCAYQSYARERPVVRLAAAVVSSTLLLLSTRTWPSVSRTSGQRALARGRAALAERAFAWAAHDNVAKLGLAEARRRQGKWVQASVALDRLQPPYEAFAEIVHAQRQAIAACDATPRLAWCPTEEDVPSKVYL